jgi:hypothetical protein
VGPVLGTQEKSLRKEKKPEQAINSGVGMLLKK